MLTLYMSPTIEAPGSGGGIQKWTYDGANWTLAYTMNGGGAVGARGLTGTRDTNGDAVLWATTAETSANRVIRVTDTGVASTFTTIATAAANTVFRGIAFAPIVTGGPTDTDGTVAGRVETADGLGIAGAVVRLSGTQNRKTITDANGFYRFENVETNGFYTVTPSNMNFTFSPSEKSFSQIGNTTNATFVGSVVANVNLLDTPEYFVRQHYLDFLGREPDEAGFNFWSDQILACGNDAACIERRTINVSAAYFQSIEFQETGGLVDRLYRASYGRNPRYAEFMPDTAAIARNVDGRQNGWEATLPRTRKRLSRAGSSVLRSAQPSIVLTDDAYVSTLISNTGASFSERRTRFACQRLKRGDTFARRGAPADRQQRKLCASKVQRSVCDDGILWLPASRSGCCGSAILAQQAEPV